MAGTYMGLIGQEVERVLPEIVSTNKSGYKTVEYSKISPLLIEAIKELDKKNEDYEKKTAEDNQSLKNQIKMLQSRIEQLERINKEK